MLTVIILTTTLLLPQPTDVDLAYMAGVLCGEVCGMPRPAMELVASNLYYDYYRLGIHGLRARWYAPPKSDEVALDIMRATFQDGPRYPQCRLVGSKSDAAHWVENGYASGEPDYTWSALDGRYQMMAFDCAWQPVKVLSAVCAGERCPL
jgi:hypothetical protein